MCGWVRGWVGGRAARRVGGWYFPLFGYSVILVNKLEERRFLLQQCVSGLAKQQC